MSDNPSYYPQKSDNLLDLVPSSYDAPVDETPPDPVVTLPETAQGLRHYNEELIAKGGWSFPPITATRGGVKYDTNPENPPPSFKEKLAGIFPTFEGFRKEVKFHNLDIKRITVEYLFPSGEVFATLNADMALLAEDRKNTVQKLDDLIRPLYDLLLAASDPDNQT